ncbi:MAG: 30S ribosomal protein S1 [Rhodospirillaceae bacterium]|nr:30S ribosomal protein S1 [Rhodospirillaceae bacterium]OUT76077.1 MAG: 30S ribosomal protein S1 [Rhodospirillaceae bacterium TMED23]|tara:strand:+ start:2555 stop:4441 length:1887 start_codon:yes stop_codon:yes gene_type:complete
MADLDTHNEQTPHLSTENFAELLEESFKGEERLQGRVVSGNILSIENDIVLIDVGLKSEGAVSLKEFNDHTGEVEIKVGDAIDVFVERFEGRDGSVMLSRDKARREEAWTVLEKAFASEERVNGVIFGRVKGGFTVDLSGAIAFLPGSQVDIRPIRDVGPLMGNAQPFQILKMDRARGNIVVSRRAVLEETRAEERTELISNLNEGQVLEGVVKNITDYGAFVDLGGVDGLLHVTDIAWKRINHPSEVLQIGQSVSVQVIRFNPENQRISLGMKQLESDPWEGAEAKYPLEAKLNGRVTNITDYGAFVELEAGIEGLVHVSEMSWTKKNVHPGKIVSTSQEVEVMVLEVDPSKRRISLGLKQCISNPWIEFTENYKVGNEAEGEIKNITEFGLFVGLTEDIDGMVHMSDLDWVKSGEEAIADYNKSDIVKVKILDIDVDKERISLGVKQLTEDPVSNGIDRIKKGDIVTCKITTVTDNGIEVLVNDDVPGFIRRADLSRDRSEQRPNRFAAGELVDALVSAVDKPARKVGLSIKAREVQEEKIAMAEFGSSDSGASLGDILGAALKERDEISEVTEEVLNEKNVLPELDPIKGQSETLDSSISKDDTKKKNSKKVSKKKDSGKADDNV